MVLWAQLQLGMVQQLRVEGVLTAVREDLALGACSSE